MHGWVVEWMDGWMAERIDWMHGWVVYWMHLWVVEWIDGLHALSGWMDG